MDTSLNFVGHLSLYTIVVMTVIHKSNSVKSNYICDIFNDIIETEVFYGYYTLIAHQTLFFLPGLC